MAPNEKCREQEQENLFLAYINDDWLKREGSEREERSFAYFLMSRGGDLCTLLRAPNLLIKWMPNEGELKFSAAAA